ncbi:MAG: chromate transporter [Chitinispirillales bacterium]|nr:chromate transporter [Chitinispirillales bacterium]
MTIILLLFWSFFIIGAAAFGGGIVTIPMIEYELVTVRGWISAAEFSELIAVAQMTPGPIAVNAATFTGFRVAGFWGAAFATAGVTMPSVIFCSILIYFLSRLRHIRWVNIFKKSVQPAVVGLVIAAVFIYGRSAVTDIWSALIALLTFAILVAFREKIHPVIIVICGGIVGIMVYVL